MLVDPAVIRVLSANTDGATLSTTIVKLSLDAPPKLSVTVTVTVLAPSST
jgi:hypothetical protein